MNRPGGRRSIRRLLPPLAILAAVLVLVLILRVVLVLGRLRDDAIALQAIGPESMIAAPSGDIDALLARTSEDFHALREDIGPLVHVLPAFSWLPRYGGDLENAPALLEFGDLAIGTARDTLALGRIVSGDADSAQSSRPPIGVAVLHASQSQGSLIRQVSRNLQKMSETRSRIDTAILSPSLREALVQFDNRAPLWQMGIDALRSAPTL